MPDTIIDSKFRLLEPLTRIAGRSRHLASDLISGQIAVLETAPIDAVERLAERWSEEWQPVLRERGSRFARHASFIPVSATGFWSEGPYYVYPATDPDASLIDLSARIPEAVIRELLEDFGRAHASGDHILNLRPEHLLYEA